MECSDATHAVIMQNVLQTAAGPNTSSVTGNVSVVFTETNQQTIVVMGTNGVPHAFKFPPNPASFQTELIRAMDHKYMVYVVYTVKRGDNVIDNAHVSVPR